jgi:ribosomal-protein-alanine N-acetyltransferase
MHSFTTERLLIRLLIEEDEAFYCYQYTDKKMMRIIGEPMSYEKASKAFFRALKANSADKKTVMTWAIVDRSSCEIIGTQALSWLKPTQTPKPSVDNIEQVEIGIMLATKANGKLLPEEAVAGLMEYGFNYLALDRINAFYAKKNHATKRILDKLGYINASELQETKTNISYQYFDKNCWCKAVIIDLL